MKNCSVCNAVLEDDALFCTACGSKIGENAPVEPAPQQAPAQETYVPPVNPNPGAPSYTNVPPAQPQYQGYQPYVDPADHTAEFKPEDVSAHKVYALIVYIGGLAGIIPALLIGKDSPYLKFHVQQKMKLMVAQLLVMMIASITSILVLPLIAAGVIIFGLFVINLICFFKTAQGKSIEPAIIKDIKIFK